MPHNMKITIAETFVAMLRHKSVDKITVKDLVETCNISRQTFYYHFQDIMEVVEWSVEQMFEKALSRGLEADTPEEALCIFIRDSKAAYPLLRKLIQSQKRDQVDRLMVQSLEKYLRELFKQNAPELALTPSDMELLLHFYTYGIAGLLLEYCSRESLDEEKLANQLYRLITGKLIAFPPK